MPVGISAWDALTDCRSDLPPGGATVTATRGLNHVRKSRSANNRALMELVPGDADG